MCIPKKTKNKTFILTFDLCLEKNISAFSWQKKNTIYTMSKKEMRTQQFVDDSFLNLVEIFIGAEVTFRLLSTELCACERVSPARPPRSRARCGWCPCGGRPLRSWLWTGTGPSPHPSCSQDLPRTKDIPGC